MHIKLTSLTLIILSLLLLVSCAETPEHDVVAEKDNQVLEDRIESSEGENAPLEENVFETFQNSDNTITFDFDSADIVIPNIQSYPVYCVAPHFWSSEEIEQVCSVALQGADVYEYTDKMTKSQIEERILELRKMLDPESMYEYYQGDEITIEAVKADAERQLSALEEAYEDADDTAEPVLSDFQYRADNEWHEETSYLYTEDSEGVDSVRATASVNGVPYWIYVKKQVSGTYLDSTFYLFTMDGATGVNEFTYYQANPLTDEETENAISDIQEQLSAMSIGDWKISRQTVQTHKDINGEKSYALVTKWQRYYNGIPAAAFPTGTGSADEETLKEDQFAANYNTESLTITYANGSITGFEYEGALEVKDTVNENVAILTASEANSRIHEQLEMTYTGKNLLNDLFAEDTVTSMDELSQGLVHITKVELSLVRVRIQDNSGEYYLLPAWTVWGWTYVLEKKSGNSTISSPLDTETIEYKEQYENRPLLVLNAVDGSVIDRSKGY